MNVVYLLTEGVHDAAFLGKLLTVHFGVSQTKRLSDLPSLLKEWCGTFKWPHEADNIARLAVPAPLFYAAEDKTVAVVVRNAQGVAEISKMLVRDMTAFDTRGIMARAIGIVLDADDTSSNSARRASRIWEELRKDDTMDWAGDVPPDIGVVRQGRRRVGVYSFPVPDQDGTLEDVLLELGKTMYPPLHTAANGYVAGWKDYTGNQETHADWNEIQKTAGVKKATVAAMAALLKPGKSITVSISDNRWVCEHTLGQDKVAACIGFLEQLLGQTPHMEVVS